MTHENLELEDKPEEKPIELKPTPAQPVQQQTEDMISKANAAAARLEEANLQHAKLIAKQELMQVEQTLSGTARAGTQNKTKEQKDIENARNMLKGTGYDEELFPSRQ